MKRIDAQGHSKNRFVPKNPATDTPGTLLDADWLNNVQEELANVIESESIKLDGKKENQLLTAIAGKIAKAVATITAELGKAETTTINITDKTLFAFPTIDSQIDGNLSYTLLSNRQVKCQLHVIIVDPSADDKDNYWLIYLPKELPKPDIKSSFNAELIYNANSSKQVLMQLMSVGSALFCGYPGADREVTPGVASFAVEFNAPNRLGLALMPSSTMRSSVSMIVVEWTYTREPA